MFDTLKGQLSLEWRATRPQPSARPDAFRTSSWPSSPPSWGADAWHYGALLLTSAHGIAGMELSGHLGTDRWRTTADELVDTLVRMVADASRNHAGSAAG